MNRLFRVFTVLLGLVLLWDLLSHLVAEILWFSKVGYLSTFLLRLQTQIGVWIIIFGISIVLVWANLWLANHLRYPDNNSLADTVTRSVTRSTITSKQSPPNPRQGILKLSLRLFLPLVLILSFWVGLLVLHYSKITFSLWQPGIQSGLLPFFASVDTLPPFWEETAFEQLLLEELPRQLWQFFAIALVVVAIIANPRFWLSAITTLLAFCWSVVLSGQWGRILRYFSATEFASVDPIFERDISVYVFHLPVWQLFEFWLGGLSSFTLVAVALTYLLSGNSFSDGKFPGFTQPQLRHLYGLGTGVAATTALYYWLSRYELLYSPRGVVYGASYTDYNVQLPVNTTLSLLAIGLTLFFLLRTIFWFKRPRNSAKAALFVSGFYVIVAIITGRIFPASVQRFDVEPNELTRELPYIEYNIALTRQAFDLDSIEVETFEPEGDLTIEDLSENELTIDNIRLWDARPLLQTNRQLQQLRLYYEFPDADIDRYSIRVEAGEDGEPEVEQPDITPPTAETQKQQVIIAPRELDYTAVPEQARTWVNRHLVYTHGYGFTLSPVNLVDEGGLPYYYVKDIGTGVETNEEGMLYTSSPLIRDSIPIGKPRIYYGELTDNYVMTSTQTQELDYPSGDENVYNTYDGTGGLALGSLWRQLLFSSYLKDWQMLFTQNFLPQTKLMFRRDIKQRVRAIAPFLRYDRDPYIVTADAGDPEPIGSTNYLYWVIDAYTTSDRYPYSDPGENDFNYIRNSVKVIVDAYNGDVDFYIADPSDPIIQTWDKIFPNLFKPLDAMPVTLQRHLRYPLDYFSAQSEQLLTYHMTDPKVFYNREDVWRIPQEIYGGEQQQVEPYYLIMKLPQETSAEFILLHPYTPVSRNNLIGWLAARSDGENYGKLLLYQFPKQELIYGPEQIEALINQDPVISQQISLWNRQGSRAIQGNLLVIPIEQSLLYVEPLYLEAEQNSLPTLVRVIVVYRNRIVMARTLEQGLQAIFAPEQLGEEAIIRQVEEAPIPLEEE